MKLPNITPPQPFSIAIVALSVKSLSLNEFAAKLDAFMLKAHKNSAKLVVLPEISIAPIIDAMKQDFFKATTFLESEIQKLAKHYSLYICGGSGIYEVNKKIYNQSFLATPDGKIIYQPKINIIELEKQLGRTGGNTIKIITTPFAKMAICVCYDIEFPEVTRKIILEGVDLILVPSYTSDQFGKNRVQFCAQARTIENHIYIASSCLVGTEGSELTAEGFGCASLYSPIDQGFNHNGIVAKTEDNQEDILIVTVDLPKLYQLRNNCSTSPFQDYKSLSNRHISIEH